MSGNKSYIPQLIEAAKAYRDYVLGTNVLIITQDKETKAYKSLECSFYDYNFMHLTGLKAIPPLTATMFFELSLNGTLPEDGFTASSWAALKLPILPMLFSFRKNNMLGLYNGKYGELLYTQSVAGGEKGSLGFVFDDEINENVPNTTIVEDTRKIAVDISRILAVYQKPFAQPLYSYRPIYLCKDLKSKADCLKWSKEIMAKIEAE